MKQVESNRLIAEFMGLEPMTLSETNQKCLNPKHNDGTISPIQFHSSWDWLMPVVDKIEDIECEEVSTDIVGQHLFDVEIRQNVCIIHGTDIEESSGSKLHCVYNAVVSFIRWYNAI
jgi:hypothetical protein